MGPVGRSGYSAPPPGAAGGANAHDLRAPLGDPGAAPGGHLDDEHEHVSDRTIVRPAGSSPAPRLTSESGLPAFPRLDPSTLVPAPREPAAAPGLRVRPDAGDAPAQPLPAWSLVLSDGVALPVYGPVVIGRNPQAAQFPGATVAAVPDPTRTMSKTHARFYVDHDSLMVDDLGSTNGIALFPGGNTQGAMSVEPGHPVEARPGDVVQLGEYEVTVRRN